MFSDWRTVRDLINTPSYPQWQLSAACKHEWEEVSRGYSSPRSVSIKEVEDAILREEILFGITTVELRCTRCGEVKFVHGVGRVDR